MTQELVLMVECRDEMGAVESGVSHESMVAGGEAVWEAWWTLSGVAVGGAALASPTDSLSMAQLEAFCKGVCAT